MPISLAWPQRLPQAELGWLGVLSRDPALVSNQRELSRLAACVLTPPCRLAARGSSALSECMCRLRQQHGVPHLLTCHMPACCRGKPRFVWVNGRPMLVPRETPSLSSQDSEQPPNLSTMSPRGPTGLPLGKPNLSHMSTNFAMPKHLQQPLAPKDSKSTKGTTRSNSADLDERAHSLPSQQGEIWVADCVLSGRSSL